MISQAARITFVQNDKGELLIRVDGKALQSTRQTIDQEVGEISTVTVTVYLPDGVVIESGEPELRKSKSCL